MSGNRTESLLWLCETKRREYIRTNKLTVIKNGGVEVKIILRGTNNDYVNFDNIFKIAIEKPRSFDDDDKTYRVMAYLGVTSEYNYGEIELFKGTISKIKNWDAWFCGEMISIPPGTPTVILDPARLAYWGQDN